MEQHQYQWEEFAACKGMTETFFGDHNLFIGEDDQDWELDCEIAAKQVCSVCPVKQVCAERALADDVFIYGPGVFGGMASWERQWLVTNQDVASRLAAELRDAGADPQELRRWCHDAGPGDLSLHPKQCATEYGFPESVAKQWYKNRGIVKRGKWRRPWSEAIRKAVLADPDRWWDQPELIKIGFPHIPDKKVEDTRIGIAETRGACSEYSARMRIMHRAVNAALAVGEFERRSCPQTGCVQIRGGRRSKIYPVQERLPGMGGCVQIRGGRQSGRQSKIA